MADPFYGEIRIFPYSQVPTGDGWAQCNGQLLPINQNQALFSLLGTTFGGNGQTTFALPDLRGRTPIHVQDNVHTLGERGGEQAHTLSIAELPQHTHVAQATSATGDTPVAPGNLLADSPSQLYAAGNSPGQTPLSPTTVTSVGGSQAHENMQPFLALNFGIALIGIFPSPN
jgi:microcystin-dependent protein